MTEHDIQSRFFEIMRFYETILPEAKYVFSIPNGGLRHIVVAKKLKKEGVKKGVPDVFIPVPKKGYYGFFIEFKTPKNRKNVSKEQKEYSSFLINQNYRYEIYCDAEEAAEEVLCYLKNDN
jgi:hypothetical protein